MFHIKVPATSANMGPGFDCVGVALELYNELWVEETDGGIDISSADGRDIPKGEKNLIYTTIKGFYDSEGLKLPGVKIVQKDSIPMTRGLGSSAACIVGGLLAANAMSGRNYTVDRLALMAAELEGHPDNSNPALMGSMVVSAMHDGEMSRIKINVPENLTFGVLIPNFALSTAESRAVLPKEYTRAQAVFNSSRTGLLIAAMMTGNLEALRVAVDDEIHQPYRKKLIRNYDDIFEKARENGSLAEYLSGAGPTLMTLITDETAEKYEKEMTAFLKTLPDKWELKLLKPDTRGAVIESE